MPHFPTAQQLWKSALADVMRDGDAVPGEKPTHELRGRTLAFDDVRRRVIAHPARRLDIVVAIARFVWMMAGSDRLADIRFYEPKVQDYSDDGVIVPGSDYGARLRANPPGLDQVAAAIDRLKPDQEHPDDPLRRVMNVIWRPEDAIRPSKDIPCALAIAYLPRAGKLEAELMLRSSNAVLLLPFNLFEFSLLAETVAVAAGLRPGAFSVHAVSLHVYDDSYQRGAAEKVVATSARDELVMPTMPSDDPVGQINELVRLEADLRHDGAEIASADLTALHGRGQGLNEYWRPFFEVLLVDHLLKARRVEQATELAAALPSWAQPGIQGRLQKAASAVRERQPGDTAVPRLWDDDHHVPTSVEKIRGALAESATVTAHIDALLAEIAGEASLTYVEAIEVKRRLMDRELPIAARSEGTEGRATDFLALTTEDVLHELERLRVGS